MKPLVAIFLALYAGLCGFCMGVTVAAPSTQWTALQGNFDFIGDQPPGQADTNIVGSGANPGLFVLHNDNGSLSRTDGTFGFRLRLDGPGGNRNNVRYERAAYLGIDADFNDTIDVFIGLNFSGNRQELGIYAAGPGANSTLGNTSVGALVTSYAVDSSTFNYRPVDFSSDGGTTNDLNPGNRGEGDFYLSVLVDFADIVAHLSGQGILITDESPLRFVAATSSQGNNLNQDVAGIDGSGDPGASFSEAGGFTESVTVAGIPALPVPEPGAVLLVNFAAVLVLLRRRR